jgi:hypothetical protein
MSASGIENKLLLICSLFFDIASGMIGCRQQFLNDHADQYHQTGHTGVSTPVVYEQCGVVPPA